METNNWFIGIILIPVVIGIFKSEIGRLFTSWNIYRLRIFDVDGDPNTPDQVQLFSGGKWNTVVIVKYCMWVRTSSRGVHIKYSNGSVRKFSFLEWKAQPKRTVPDGERIINDVKLE